MYTHNLRAPLDISAPEPTGVCDRCYFYYPLAELRWQYDFRGNSLQNLRIRVCPRCLDVPADQLRPVIITGPEGVVRDPRPYQYAANAAGGVPPPTSDDLTRIFDTQIPEAAPNPGPGPGPSPGPPAPIVSTDLIFVSNGPFAPPILAGTVIGMISVVPPAWVGALLLGGPDGADFAISAAGILTNTVDLGGGDYNITITAVP